MSMQENNENNNNDNGIEVSLVIRGETIVPDVPDKHVWFSEHNDTEGRYAYLILGTIERYLQEYLGSCEKENSIKKNTEAVIMDYLLPAVDALVKKYLSDIYTMKWCTNPSTGELYMFKTDTSTGKNLSVLSNGLGLDEMPKLVAQMKLPKNTLPLNDAAINISKLTKDFTAVMSKIDPSVGSSHGETILETLNGEYDLDFGYTPAQMLEILYNSYNEGDMIRGKEAFVSTLVSGVKNGNIKIPESTYNQWLKNGTCAFETSMLDKSMREKTACLRILSDTYRRGEVKIEKDLLYVDNYSVSTARAVFFFGRKDQKLYCEAVGLAYSLELTIHPVLRFILNEKESRQLTEAFLKQIPEKKPEPEKGIVWSK